MSRQSCSTVMPRVGGAAGTVLFHGLLLLVLLLAYLVYPPSDQPDPQPAEEETGELLLAGEYVLIGDDVTVPGDAVQAPQPQQVAVEESPETDAIISSTTPRADAIPVPPKQDDSRRAAATEARIKERVNFSSTGKTGTDAARAGSRDGNTTSADAALSGAPGHSLKGRSLAHWEKPVAYTTGIIVVSVRVNREGKVISATYLRGSGNVASSAKARSSCVQAALQSAFSVDTDGPAEQRGTITYKFVGRSGDKNS